MADTLRAEFQTRWAEQVSQPWAERHAQAQAQRARLAELRERPTRTADEEIEMLKLTQSLEPEVDLREPLAAFNVANADHPLGLFLEGSVRLDKGEREGLALLDRACTLDADAIKPASQRAYAFLLEQRDKDAAEVYAERWRGRDALETLRAQQLQNLDGKDRFAAHGLPDESLSTMKILLSGKAREHIAEVYVARREIPADPSAVQWVMGVQLSWWGRRRGKQADVVKRLADMDWPVPLLFVTLDGRFAPWLKQLRKLGGARLI
jgi:hypothetical protein